MNAQFRVEKRSVFTIMLSLRSGKLVSDDKDGLVANVRWIVSGARSRSIRRRRSTALIDWHELSRADILAAMQKAGIDEGVRAETMSLQDFDRLARALDSR